MAFRIRPVDSGKERRAESVVSSRLKCINRLASTSVPHGDELFKPILFYLIKTLSLSLTLVHS